MSSACGEERSQWPSIAGGGRKNWDRKHQPRLTLRHSFDVRVCNPIQPAAVRYIHNQCVYKNTFGIVPVNSLGVSACNMPSISFYFVSPTGSPGHAASTWTECVTL